MLAKVLSESNYKALGIKLIIEEGGLEDQQRNLKTSKYEIYTKYKGSSWYNSIIHYLLFLRCSLGMDTSKYQSLRLQVQKYIISNGLLYYKDPMGVWLLCLVEGKTHKVIGEFHEGVYGGSHS